MKFYLSSYKLGDEKYINILKEWFKKRTDQNKRIAVIPNAIDYSTKGKEFIDAKNQRSVELLKSIGLESELLDLKDYFPNQKGTDAKQKKTKLKTKLHQFAAVFVRGGNTFVLKAAMKLSGFDDIITHITNKEHKKTENPNEFIYSGYSAGICILAPNLNCLDIVDDPNQFPYKNRFNKDTNEYTIATTPQYEGLNFLNYVIMPHYQSDHPEAQDVNKEIERCIKLNVPYKPLKDGDVIIIQN